VRCSPWAWPAPPPVRPTSASWGCSWAQEHGVDDFLAATLGPVLDYDRRRSTTLTRTLSAYFAAGGSPARAAEALLVHVNTVTQRLERLSTLLGEDWQRPDRALELQVALRLHHLRSA
jgi:DNA-binding PucR family transcriptional regulator